MKIKTNTELNYSAGRAGIKAGVIEVTITTTKNSDAQTVNLSIVDYAEVEPATPQDPMTMGGKLYLTQSSELLSYTQYDAMLAEIQAVKLYEETGSELEDLLIQDYLLQKVSTEGWYNSVAINWIKVEVPVV